MVVASRATALPSARWTHEVAIGYAISRVPRRDQTTPSICAASRGALSRITLSLFGGHRDTPRASRLHSMIPDPSQARILSRSVCFEKDEYRSRKRIVPEFPAQHREGHRCLYGNLRAWLSPNSLT